MSMQNLLVKDHGLLGMCSESIPILNHDIMYVKAIHDSQTLPISRGKL